MKTNFYLCLLASFVNLIAVFLFLTSFDAIPKIAGILFFASSLVHLVRAIRLKYSTSEIKIEYHFISLVEYFGGLLINIFLNLFFV